MRATAEPGSSPQAAAITGNYAVPAVLDPLHRRMFRILDLYLIGRRADAISPVAVFRHQTLKPNSHALRNSSGPISPCSKSLTLAHGKRKFPKVVAIKRQTIERVELHLTVKLE